VSVYCKDCKWADYQVVDYGSEYGKCKHPRSNSRESLITPGQYQHLHVTEMRSHDGACGPRGELFELAPPKKPKKDPFPWAALTFFLGFLIGVAVGLTSKFHQ